MNKKLFILFTIIFSLIIIFFLRIKYTDINNYNYQNINGVNIKGDTKKYPVSLIRKIDGDTIIVSFNNKELTIRYLLIDTPETVKPNTPIQKYGPEASEFNEKILKTSKKIEIEFDVYQKKDKYNRALCYVYADGKSVQEQLLKAGLAEIKYVKEPDTRYLKDFKKAQNSAKGNKLGLWSID